MKRKVLVVLGMGGHTAQILRLVEMLGDAYNYEYVIGHDDQTSTAKIKFPGRVHLMRNPRLMEDKSLAKVAVNMIPASFQAIQILQRARPYAILSAGPALTIPLFWLAKMKGIKTMFVESWVRVHHKSLTGKLVYPISDLFIVQWESMKKVYPKAVYAGRLS